MSFGGTKSRMISRSSFGRFRSMDLLACNGAERRAWRAFRKVDDPGSSGLWRRIEYA